MAPPPWAYTAASITETVTAAIATTEALLDQIAALPKADRTFESVVRALALREGEQSVEVEPCLFLQYVSTDATVRDASVEADKLAQVSRRVSVAEWRTVSDESAR